MGEDSAPVGDFLNCTKLFLKMIELSVQVSKQCAPLTALESIISTRRDVNRQKAVIKIPKTLSRA